jgi:hypothetical protein
MPRAKAGAASATRKRPRVETAEDELARLIREQREDQRQDRQGLRSTLLGECLRGVGVCLDDDLPRKSRLPNMDEQ